jgi:hypothetical protein
MHIYRSARHAAAAIVRSRQGGTAPRRAAPPTLTVLLATLAIACGAAEPAGEALDPAVPSGWTRVSHRDVGARHLDEYVPPGQDAERWSEMLSVIAIDGLRGFEPAEHVATMTKRYRLACESFRSDELVTAVSDGRRSAQSSFWCSQYRQQSTGEIKLVRYLEGDGRLYVIERVWRGAPFDFDRPPLSPERLKDWRAQLGAARVCGPKETCPKGGR